VHYIRFSFLPSACFCCMDVQVMCMIPTSIWVHWPAINISCRFLYNKLYALISQIYFAMKLYMLWAVCVSIIRSLFTVHSAMVYVIQVCRVWCQNEVVKLVHVVGFIRKKFVMMHGHTNITFPVEFVKNITVSFLRRYCHQKSAMNFVACSLLHLYLHFTSPCVLDFVILIMVNGMI
jgi:hypothetical protein